jgi:hypothetical protein
VAGTGLRAMRGGRGGRTAGFEVAFVDQEGGEVRLSLGEAAAVPLVEGVDGVGGPIAVLPTVFHLLWSRQLRTDLSARLDATSLVSAAAA